MASQAWSAAARPEFITAVRPRQHEPGRDLMLKNCGKWLHKWINNHKKL
jgi:hypothetical protein